MIMFDDIPEDREEIFSCRNCHQGSITRNIVNGKWECDNCEFSDGDDGESDD